MKGLSAERTLKALFSWTLFNICKSIDGLGYLFLGFLCLLL